MTANKLLKTEPGRVFAAGWLLTADRSNSLNVRDKWEGRDVMDYSVHEKFLANLSTLWIILVAAAPVSAEVASNMQYEYYTVQVSNKDDVPGKAFDATLINLVGQKFLAFTKWRLNYKYSSKSNAGI